MPSAGVSRFQLCDSPAKPIPCERYRHLPFCFLTKRMQLPHNFQRHMCIYALILQCVYNPRLTGTAVFFGRLLKFQIYFFTDSLHKIPPKPVLYSHLRRQPSSPLPVEVRHYASFLSYPVYFLLLGPRHIFRISELNLSGNTQCQGHLCHQKQDRCPSVTDKRKSNSRSRYQVNHNRNI